MVENRKRKKIIFILTVLGPGGAEKIISIIANNLNREIYEPKVILFSKNPEYMDMLKEDVGVLETKTNRIRDSLLPILKFIYKEKPDIVFAGYGEVNAYLSLFIKLFPNTKFIARETNVVSQHVTRKEIRFFYRFYNNFHKIIAQSDDMYHDLVQNFKIKPDKLSKINNPVDFDLIRQKLANETAPLEFSSEVKNVVAVGNLSARKGFDLLLKVFSHLKNEKIHLHILGDGKDKEELLAQKEALQLDNVFFHGQKKNPYPYLKFADLFILSSRYEGFPNVLLEAGACGTYSLANDCPGGIREIVLEGINGEIAKIEDDEIFANTIIEILSKNHDHSSIKESIESRYSLPQIFRMYEEVLGSM